jgi:Flp pilus assembly protein TadD
MLNIIFITSMVKKLLPLGLGLLLLVSGCAGGKGFRMEIATGDDSSERLQELQESHQPASVPQNDLPDPTGDEFERMGDALLGKESYYLAYVHYEKSLKLKPDNLRVEYKKGLTLLLAKKNDEAIKQFNLVLEKDPEYSLAYEGLGRAHFQKRSYSTAEKNLRKAVELDPHLWRSFDYLGNILDYRKQHDMAIVEYNSAILAKPDEGSLYNNLGVSYSMAGKPDAAVEAFEMAIERNFRESRVYNNLGLAYANMKKYDQAFEAFRKGGGEARAYNNLGVIYLSRGRYADAAECFEMAIELEPSFYATAGENLKKARLLSRRQ